MAERISGLSISLDLDSTGIDRSLTQIKNSFSSLRRSAQVNMNNVKFDTKNITDYKRHVNELSKSYDAQKKNVNDLYTKMNDLKSAGKENTDEFRKLNTEYNRQADELNKLSHHMDIAKKKMHELNVENSNFTKVGKGLGGVSDAFQSLGGTLTRVGGTLTKSITMPAIGAATAVGGIVAAFGWSRLSAMDTASAQLQGFTGDAKTSERIMKDVKEASQTGMATLAENTAIATGALAAGISEGADLVKYINLVGDAAQASGAPIEEMSQIFNRVQGTGKLMGTELQMVENRLPGFTSTMAKSMNMTMEEFKSAVSEGEISAEDFQKAMTERVDGTAELMANTWSGMTQNLKAYLGILGEAALSETFDTMKNSLSGLIDVLKSDTATEFAKQMGEKLGETIKDVTEKVKGAITWFTALDTDTQKLFGKLALGAVALGPLLMVFGKISLGISAITGVIAPLFLTLGKLSGGIATVTSGMGTFAGIFPKLAGVLGIITGPIGITVGAIIGLGTAFTIAYKNSEMFRDIVQGAISKVSEGIVWIKDFGNAIRSIFSNDEDEQTGGQKLLEKLGLSETSIEMIQNGINTVKRTFGTIFEKVSEVLSAVWEFVQQTFIDFQVWWEADGALIISAIGTLFKDTFKVISDVVKIAFDVIMNTFEIVLPIIQGIWDTFWPLIKATVVNTWNTIKLIIGTTMDLIRGIISAVSAAIEGDWSRVWTIVKDTAVSIWNRIKSYISDTINNIKNTVGQRIQETKEKFVQKLSEMLTNTINYFKDMYNTGRNKITDFKNTVVNNINQMKNDALNKLNDLVQGAKDLPGKMKDAFIAGKNKVAEGITSLGNSMQNKLKSVINGVIKGMNAVLGKVGVNANITTWEPAPFSRGTGASSPLTRNGAIAEDTFATVGDKGPGNGKGVREIVEYPNGKVSLFEKETDIFAPKGTKVYNNQQTEKIIPHLSTGTGAGLWQKTKDKVSSLGNGIKNIAKNAMDYITNPTKVFDAIVDNYFSGFTGITGFAKDMIGGAWNKIKNGMLNWIKDKFATVGGKGTGKKQSFMDYPITSEYSPGSALAGYPGFNGGRHYGIDYGTPFGTPIHAPTGGTVKEISNLGGGIVARLKNGNITQFFMHLSRVLKKGTVKMGELIAMSGNSGAWTTGPHVHWQAQEGSDIMNQNTFDPRKMLKGHSDGGHILKGGMFNLHDDEYVIPMNKPTQAMKLLALAANRLKGKSKQTSELPNLMPNNDSKVEEKLDAMIGLLTQLLAKDTNINIDGKQLNNHLTEISAIESALRY